MSSESIPFASAGQCEGVSSLLSPALFFVLLLHMRWNFRMIPYIEGKRKTIAEKVIRPMHHLISM